MKKLLKYTACLVILLMVVVLFTGCKVTGGGYFMNNEVDKCTFGFNAQGTGECLNWDYKGQFQFKDHVSGQKIHIGKMMLLWNLGDGAALFGGTDKEGKGVAVLVTDMGEPGPGAGDEIKIWYDLSLSSLFDPPSWEPDWAGVIEGGNIQIHEED